MRKTRPRHTIVRMPYRKYISSREAAFERQEQLAQNERREYRKQMERFRQIEQRVEAMQNGISRQDPHGGRLLKKKMKAVKSQEHRFELGKRGYDAGSGYGKGDFCKNNAGNQDT